MDAYAGDSTMPVSSDCPEENDEDLQPLNDCQAQEKPDLLVGVTLQQLQGSSRARCWFCSTIYNGIESALESSRMY
jgi:hypothetical protein